MARSESSSEKGTPAGRIAPRGVPPGGPPSGVVERASVTAATIGAGLILLQQIGAKAARDALFLTHFPARELPKIMAGAALLSLVVVLASARAMARLGPSRLLPVTLGLNAALFGAEAVLSVAYPAATALVLYLHVAALGSVLVSGFWSLVTERFDPHRARRYVGRIGVGATLGGAIGGLVADLVTRLLSSQGLLVFLAVTSVSAAFVLRRVGRGARVPAAAQSAEPESPLAILKKTPYLWLLAALAALTALWAALLDYALKAEVSVAVRDPNDLMRFFGWFYTATGILTFLVQAVLGERVLRRHGIGLAVGLLPTFVAAFALLAGLVDVFALLVALRAVESVLANSIHRASYELFFTPLPQSTKRPTKTIVDVAATRIGDALGSSIVLIGLAVSSNLSIRVPILIAAGAAFAAFTLVPRIHGGYVGSLTAALRSGTVKLDESQGGLDALTQRTLAESTQLVDREKLLAEIEAFRKEQVAAESAPKSKRSRGLTTGAGPPASVAPASIEARFAATLDPIVSTALILASRDPDRVRRVLARSVDPELVGFVLPMLGMKSLAKEAEQALAQLGPRIVGALTDALFDDRLSRGGRARVARLLGGIDSVRAREGLFEGLGIPVMAIRLECGRSIGRIARRTPALAPERERVFAAVAAVLGQESSPLDVQGSVAPSAPDEAERSSDAALRLEPRMQLSLALLSATLDEESVTLTARALAGGDASLRGTALEYLENVLEEPAKSAMLKALAGTNAVVAKRRTLRELREELQRTKA